MDNTKKASKYEYLLSRFFTLQIKYVITILSLLSFFCFLISYVLKYDSFWGGIFYTAGITVIIALLLNGFYEWMIRKKSDQNLLDAIDAVSSENFKKEVPNAIAKSIILDPSVLIPHKDERVTKLLLASLQSRLGEEIGREIVEGPLQSIIGECQKRLCYDMMRNVELRPLKGELKEDFDALLIRHHYKTVLQKEEFKFACVTDPHLYFENIGKYEDLFLSTSLGKYGIESISKVYNVVSVDIDQIPLKRTGVKKGETIYEISYSHPDLREKIGKKVLISYTFESVFSKEGNYYMNNIVYPTKTVTITVSSEIALSYIDPTAFFVSSERPNLVSYDKNTDKNIFSKVSINDWVFPYSGVIFVWSRK